MKKFAYLLKEMARMIRRHRMYFIAPILFFLALLIFLVYYIGPAVVMTFIYAGF